MCILVDFSFIPCHLFLDYLTKSVIKSIYPSIIYDLLSLGRSHGNQRKMYLIWHIRSQDDKSEWLTRSLRSQNPSIHCFLALKRKVWLRCSKWTCKIECNVLNTFEGIVIKLFKAKMSVNHFYFCTSFFFFSRAVILAFTEVYNLRNLLCLS